jgi:hypothetical protein
VTAPTTRAEVEALIGRMALRAELERPGPDACERCGTRRNVVRTSLFSLCLRHCPRLPDPDELDMLAEHGPPPELTAGRKSKRERGYRPWTPRSRARATLDQVLAIFEKYEDQRPLTGRQVLYRMMVHFDHPKEIEGHLYYVLDRGRRAKLIPFEWVRDDNIVTYSSPWYDGPEDFWDETGRRIKDYRRDRQAGQRVRIELWCEAAGMGPQLDRVARDYSVPVFSNGGNNSISAQRQVVDHALGRDVPTVLLHVGDFDPYGEDIFTAFVENAQAFLAEDRIVGTQRIEPVRVALTDAQVQALGLPTQPTKKAKEKSQATLRERWVARYGDRTCQAEALPPDVLAKVVQEAIEDHLDLDRRQEQVEQEEPDRTEMLRALPAGEAA